MMRACACAVLVLSAASPALAVESRGTETLVLGQLSAGRQIDLVTEDVTYRATLVDPATGECRVRLAAGQRQTSPRTVYLIGATRGQQDGLSLVKMGEVKVGYKVEIGLDDLTEANRAHTAPVVAIRLAP